MDRDSRKAPPEKVLAISAQGIAVYVINDNPADARVYLLRGSTPIRLATVGSFEQRLVWISPAEAPSSGTLQLMVQPAGSPTPHFLNAVDLMPGGAVELWVRANIRLSHAVARPSSPR